MSIRPNFVRRHRILTSVLGVTVAAALALGVFVRVRMQGPYRDYRVDTEFISARPGEAGEGPLYIGVAVRDITPDLSRFDHDSRAREH